MENGGPVVVHVKVFETLIPNGQRILMVDAASVALASLLADVRALCMPIPSHVQIIPDVTLTQLDGYLGSTLKYAANV